MGWHLAGDVMGGWVEGGHGGGIWIPALEAWCHTRIAIGVGSGVELTGQSLPLVRALQAPFLPALFEPCAQPAPVRSMSLPAPRTAVPSDHIPVGVELQLRD
mgnify:CR=1 FL=1